jgi:uncharacterized protein
MIKVVADTNIYISAILFGGKPEKIINLAASEKIILFISHAIIAEVASVLKNKFKWNNRQVEDVDQFSREISVLVTPSNQVNIVTADNADNRILECALESQANYIISGDRQHLLPLKTFNDIKIVSASDFLVLFEKQHSI